MLLFPWKRIEVVMLDKDIKFVKAFWNYAAS